MLELRILSGLHRGATLPLIEDSYLIGADENADVVLVDDGVQAQHARLSRSDAGWLLSSEDGAPLFSADTNIPQTVIDLAEGVFARVGDIWITVATPDASWEKPPLPPVEMEFDPVTLDEPAPLAALAEPEPQPAPDAPQAESDTPPPAPVEDKPAGPRKRLTGRWMLATPVLGVVLLSAAAAFALAPRSMQSDGKRNNLKTAAPGKERPNAGTPSTAGGPGNMATPQELQRIFRKRLADAELLKWFDMNLEDYSWSMQASLDDEETIRFNRILNTFISEYQVSFPVNAKIVAPEAMLPFKVRQVLTGTDASIVTQDGERVYVGDEIRGVRLVAIQDNRLIFFGKRKIEMAW